MSFRAAQVNFSRGEIAPHLYARFDVEAWSSAVRQARNVMVLKFGGLTKRPGTVLVAEVLDASTGNRLIPFQFSLTQTYALELGQAYMAPIASGGRILEDELAITAITNANEAQITAAFHAYAAGDAVYLTGISGTLGGLLNNRIWTVVTVIDENTFTIDADTSALGAFTEASGGTARTEAPEEDDTEDPVVTDPVEDPDPPTTTGGGLGTVLY